MRSTTGLHKKLYKVNVLHMCDAEAFKFAFVLRRSTKILVLK